MNCNYTCAVYGVYEPSPKDRLFYYSGENYELHGNSIEDIQRQYNALAMKQPGTIKTAADIFCGHCCVGTISSDGFNPLKTDLITANAKAKSVAVKNAEELGVEQDVLLSIQRGNIHEISFFSDARVFDWLGAWKVGEQISMFDCRFGL